MSSPKIRVIRAAAAIALAWAAAVSFAAAPGLAASNRNYLTVQGRVMDHLGRPVRDAWVFCLGSRRASARVDSAGWYRLEIPGATLEELQRAPLKIRIQARKGGWRFALSSGAPELGLEMRVISEESRLARLRVRSNDSTAVESVANSVVLDSNPRALIQAVFVGSEGPQIETHAVPLDVIQEIKLAGGSESIPEFGAAESLALPVRPGGGPQAASSPVATNQLKPASEPGAATVPATNQDAPSTGEPITNAQPPLREEPGGRAKVVRPAKGALDRPRVIRPARDSGGTPASAPPSSPASQTSVLAGSQPSSLSPAPKSGALANPRDTLGSVTGSRNPSPPGATSSGPAPAGPRRATDRDGGRAERTDGRPAKGAKQSGRGESTPDGDRTLQRVYSRYDPMVSVGLRPEAPARRVPEVHSRDFPDEGAAPGEQCDCVIRGTVEVQSDYPLRGRTEVVIAVEDAPQVTSNVELFMGSPRGFEIRRAPCGVHRLRLYTRSKQRFVLISVEPRVVCRDGSKQQIRLVMEPVARWGIAR
jgi:hypothetical protein